MGFGGHGAKSIHRGKEVDILAESSTPQIQSSFINHINPINILIPTVGGETNLTLLTVFYILRKE